MLNLRPTRLAVTKRVKLVPQVSKKRVPMPYSVASDPMPDQEQKRAALSYLTEAWAEARHDGVDGDCLAQASLFAALAELVGTYGEDAVANFAEGLSQRVRNGEFSLALAKQ
jgi:hypothetical protein